MKSLLILEVSSQTYIYKYKTISYSHRWERIPQTRHFRAKFLQTVSSARIYLIRACGSEARVWISVHSINQRRAYKIHRTPCRMCNYYSNIRVIMINGCRALAAQLRQREMIRRRVEAGVSLARRKENNATSNYNLRVWVSSHAGP